MFLNSRSQITVKVLFFDSTFCGTFNKPFLSKNLLYHIIPIRYCYKVVNKLLSLYKLKKQLYVVNFNIRR